jgi:hypothetical protein
MAVCGLAPEDDDGNAASAPPPAKSTQVPMTWVVAVQHAIEHKEDDWLRTKVLNAAPEVRAALAKKLSADELAYLSELRASKDTPDSASSDELPD